MKKKDREAGEEEEEKDGKPSKHRQPEGSHFSVEPLVLLEHGLLRGLGRLLLAADLLVQPLVLRLEASQQLLLLLAFLLQSRHLLLGGRFPSPSAAHAAAARHSHLALQVF